MAAFNLEKFAAWKAETDPKKALRLRNELIVENLPLAKKFAYRCMRASGLSLEDDDVFQAAYLGLEKTLNKFDPARAKFSTYAWGWVRERVQELALKPAEFIRRPRNQPGKKTLSMPYPVFMRLLEIRARFGREATPEELSENLRYQRPGAKADIVVTQEDIDRWDLGPVVFSLDTSFDGDDGDGHVTPGANVPDSSPTPFDALANEASIDGLREALIVLTDREQEVIEALFFEERGVEELAQEMGRSAETVRKIKIAALEKLKDALTENEE